MKLAKTMPLLVASMLFSSHAIAAEQKMTCKNPKRSYEAVFDAAVNSFTIVSAGPTASYQVEQSETTAPAEVDVP